MRRLLIILPFLLLILSCSKEEIGLPQSSHNQDIVQKSSPRILLEVFTGYNCTTCPLAFDEVAKIKEKYDDLISIKSIHASALAYPLSAEIPDYRTSNGTELFENSQIIGIPALMLNRCEPFFVAELEERLEEALNREIPINIQASQMSTHGQNHVSLDIQMEGEILDNQLLEIAIIENDLVSPQKHAIKGALPEYPHQYVLRNTWQTNIPSHNFNYQFELDPRWNINNTHALLSIIENGKVISTTELKLN